MSFYDLDIRVDRWSGQTPLGIREIAVRIETEALTLDEACDQAALDIASVLEPWDGISGIAVGVHAGPLRRYDPDGICRDAPEPCAATQAYGATGCT